VTRTCTAEHPASQRLAAPSNSVVVADRDREETVAAAADRQVSIID